MSFSYTSPALCRPNENNWDKMQVPVSGTLHFQTVYNIPLVEILGLFTLGKKVMQVMNI